jgi:acetyl-CoA carboxylase carboxyl transferase subunit beta
VKNPVSGSETAEIPKVKCSYCRSEHPTSVLEDVLYICPKCNHYCSVPSRVRISHLADQGTFRELDSELVSVDPLRFSDSKAYRDRLLQARQQTGVREAVTTGICSIGGHPAVLVIFDFQFMGGTMGSAVGEKIARAFEKAIERRLPLVSVAASGGARVQEGMFSLMQMAKVAAAAARHDRAGLAFISIFSDPTFGGVTASFASLGDIVLAEPGAQIGFVGPRVVQQTTGVPPPEDSHTAESLLRAGLIDLVVPRQNLPTILAYLLDHLQQQTTKIAKRERSPRNHKGGRLAAWDQVRLARHPGRPTARQYIAGMDMGFLELHGDRWGGDDPAIIGGLAQLDGNPVFVIGQERGSTPEEREASRCGMAYPAGYRKTQRLMKLAGKFGIPVVTLIDCPNAQTNWESEHGGIAYTLATNLKMMSNLPAVIVSVIIGEGGSGGALALGVADRVLMMEHAIYSVISPEGAAAILYRNSGHAEMVADSLKLTAHDLRGMGIIDVIVSEPQGGAHRDPGAAAEFLKTQLISAVRDLQQTPLTRLLEKRYQKFRHIGQDGVYWREVVRGGITRVFGRITKLLSGTPKAPAWDATAISTSTDRVAE